MRAKERREKARKMFQDGMELLEIADELRVPYPTIVSDKRRDKIPWKMGNTALAKKQVEKDDELELTQVERDLIDYYFIHRGSKGKAYRLAYGVSAEQAHKKASRKFNSPQIKEAIRIRRELDKQDLNIDVQGIIEDLMKIWTANPLDYLEISDLKYLCKKTGEEKITKVLKPRKDINEADMFPLQGIKKGKDGWEFQLMDKYKILPELRAWAEMYEVQTKEEASKSNNVFESLMEQLKNKVGG